MSNAHELRVYAYVNRPYALVRDVLQADPLSLFQRATVRATARAQALVSTLRATVGPIELVADVAVKVTSVEPERPTPLGPATRIHLTWEASKRPELFPTMEATLDVYALAPAETQVDFSGRYTPPLGVVGAALDALVGHRLAEAGVHRFVEDVAERLRLDVTTR
jgi:hypothetical protein